MAAAGDILDYNYRQLLPAEVGGRFAAPGVTPADVAE